MTSSAAVPPDAPLHLVDTTMFWSPSSGGVRRYLLEKRAWVARHPQWRHSIVTPMHDAVSPARIDALPLPGTGGYRLPWNRAADARTLASLEPDVIEAGDPYRLAWSALDAARRRGIPAVAFCHSNLELLAATLVGPRAGGVAGRLARRYARHLYSQFDLVLAPSQAMRRHLLDWGVERVAHQPLGVDTTVFHPEQARADWRASLGLPADSRVLVYAGRFAPEKHLDVLAGAVRRLGSPYVLLAIGGGPRPPHGERVRILPHVASPADLATALASADAFVHAGDQETFGLSALEALACGTPLVARRAEGLAELVDDRVGVPVLRGDVASFAEAIASLFERDRGSLAAAARQRAQRHDWSRVFPALFGHYGRLVQRGAMGPDEAATARAPTHWGWR